MKTDQIYNALNAVYQEKPTSFDYPTAQSLEERGLVDKGWALEGETSEYIEFNDDCIRLTDEGYKTREDLEEECGF